MQPERIPIQPLIKKLEELKKGILDQEKKFPPQFFERIHPSNQKSARNLINYLSLRSFNLRALQEQLSTLGLSSLSHIEGYTLSNINNLLYILDTLCGDKESGELCSGLAFDYPSEKRKLDQNTIALFGPARRRGSRIMVTMPSEAAHNYELVEELLKSGMDVARINCSHDNEEKWLQMINNIKQAGAKLRLACKIYMDLPGPKLRTGGIFNDCDKLDRKKGAAIRLHVGDRLHIHRKQIKGRKAEKDKKGRILKPATISMSIPEIWKDIRVGDSIFFDDGKIGGSIEVVKPEIIEVLITRARPEKGSLLRSDKGINLPKTRLSLPALTEADLRILPFACTHADMIGYSFVRKPADVAQLQRKLQDNGKEGMPIILKIETREAFRNLPDLLLESMRNSKVGVMLARGDLAVEVGFTRIAEVQEQILWLCEAAHVPVIWSTQVLENLITKGLASRAEITDAAMSVRAECVMLNKGPFAKEAILNLVNINERMVDHLFKKHAALRPLNVAKRFLKRNSG